MGSNGLRRAGRIDSDGTLCEGTNAEAETVREGGARFRPAPLTESPPSQMQNCPKGGRMVQRRWPPSFLWLLVVPLLGDCATAPATDAVATSPRPADAVASGGEIRAPRPEHRVDPVYPADLRQAGVDGDVVVEATIGSDGIVRNARAISGDPRLQPLALAAVRQWRFRPGTMNGKPVDVLYRTTITFHLSK